MADGGVERGAEALDKIITDGGKKKPRKKHLRSVPTGGDTFDAGGRRVIRHGPGRAVHVLEQIRAALAECATDLGVFYFADRPVHVYHSPGEQIGNAKHPQGAVLLHQFGAAHAVELMMRAAPHEKFDARVNEWVPCDCPRRTAEMWLDSGHHPELKRIDGINEAPTLTVTGRLLGGPGYDPETRLYMAFHEIPGYTSPPPEPSMEEAEHALTTLLDPFREFPLVGYEDRAGVVAGIVSGLLARSLPATPMPVITAPAAGTGKSKIADSISLIACGRRPSVLSLGHDEAETEKRLAGVLLAGSNPVVLDNVETALEGVLPCQVISQSSVLLRPLGGSGMVSVPTNVLLMATGNNVVVKGDLKRRVMLVRLDAGMERPEQRTFARDHLADIAARRGELIRAALTIPLAYLAAGAPRIEGLTPLGGFEEWDCLVRRPLVWLGMPDPLKASDSLREQDPDLESMRLLLAAWHERFKDAPATAAEVAAAGMETVPMNGEHAHPALYDALQIVCAEKPNPRRLGNWLRTHRDRIVDGLLLRQAGRGDGHTKVARWHVMRVA